MIKFSSVSILLLFFFSFGFSQAKKPYRTGATELIFSYGVLTDSAGGKINSQPRFSGFFNQQQQVHFDFGKHIGLYTGLGVRNVGVVARPVSGVRVKQRAYGLGIPIAVKLGNMDLERYFAIGGEAEYFFHYKEKFFFNGKKHKYDEWFSDRATPFNPSVFLQWEDANGVFIRAKYYFYDFLKPQNNLMLNDSTFVPGYSKSSMFFTLSIGINISSKDKSKIENTVKHKPTAYFNSKD